MACDDGYGRYRDAAAVLRQVTKARAERMVRDVVTGGEVQRAQAQEWVDEMVERGRKATADLVDVVRAEVSNQLQGLGLDPDDLARKVADILRRSAEAGRRVVRDAAEQAGGARRGSRTSPRVAEEAGKEASEPAAAAPKKAGAKRAAPKKAATTKAAAKKSAPKKAATTKAAAKKSGAATPSARRAAPKKAATTKAAAKRAAAKKAGPASESSPDARGQGTPR